MNRTQLLPVEDYTKNGINSSIRIRYAVPMGGVVIIEVKCNSHQVQIYIDHWNAKGSIIPAVYVKMEEVQGEMVALLQMPKDNQGEK